MKFSEHRWVRCGLIAGLIGWASTVASSAAERYHFALTTADGELVSVAPDPNVAVTVVCFLGTECPLVQLYSKRLSEMADEYAAGTEHSAGRVRLIGVNSNRQDSADDLREFLKRQPLSFPVVRDEANMVADRYGATRTPEVFVLDRTLALRYQGRIDDQYSPGVTRAAASRKDLRTAIEELLAGHPVSVPVTTAVGCLIGKIRHTPSDTGGQPETATPAANVVTYSNQVSRVLQKHCVECHRKGEIGPFSMESYNDVLGWADAMLEVIDNGRMPPWHADPQHGTFSNARILPEDDRRILRDWVAAGMAEGDESQLPPPIEYGDGWQLPRTPDLVLPMHDRPYRVPAEGTVEYQYFVVDPGFTEDKWVTAAQIIPGSRAVVHHAIAFIRPPDGSPFRGVGWLTAYVPGQRLNAMPPGHARKVPAGSRLVFQMHYTTNGSAQEDLTRIGIVFGQPEDVTHELLTVIGLDQEFEIPPNAAKHIVTGKVGWFPKNGRLLAIAPHMHFRGRQFQMTAERDGQSTTLLHVPRYDFNWQHAYELAEPLPLTDVDALKFAATFDNSKDNPFNPDPSQWVNWGDQTWEEMAVAFVEVSEPRTNSNSADVDDTVTDSAAESHTSGPPSPPISADRERRVQNFVDEFFRSLDVNQDGVVLRAEVPVSVRGDFRRFDHDNDNRASREEVRHVAEVKFGE